MAEVDTHQLETLLSAVRTLEPLIRAHIDEAERNRRFSQPVVTAPPRFESAGHMLLRLQPLQPPFILSVREKRD